MIRVRYKEPSGFTLIELVMVIAIVGILAAIALPTFQNLTRNANEGAARGGLGAIRAAVAIEYARSAVTGADPAFPADITATMFADGSIPTNPTNSLATVNEVASTIDLAGSGAAFGWWYVTTGADEGRVGAYVDDTTLSDPTSW